MNWLERSAGLRCLTALAPRRGDEGLGWLTELTQALAEGDGEGALDGYTCLYRCLAQGGFDSLGGYLGAMLRRTETVCGRRAEARTMDRSLEGAARAEFALLDELARLEGEAWIAALKEGLPEEYAGAVETLPRWQREGLGKFDALIRTYEGAGCGLFGQYRAFVWTGEELLGVEDPDVPEPEELIGYERQRAEVLENTRALVAGRAVNNALLFGDGGTGKSATVKNLLAVPGLENLRLIEVEKGALALLPQLIRTLRDRRQKFILFIDDLAFDQDDRTYGALKTILEGGLERRPGNVAIYATSNRRNLVRQTFSDRAGDEVDAAETVAEKTALAERFGLRVAYLTLNQTEYLATVDALARLAGVELEPGELHRRALEWERYHHGCTPRTARQFVASLG